MPWHLGSLCCFRLTLRHAVCRAEATRQQFWLSLTLSKPNYRGFRASASPDKFVSFIRRLEVHDRASWTRTGAQSLAGRWVVLSW